MKQENPDILIVQEAYNAANPRYARKLRSIQTIQDAFGFEAYDFAPALLDNVPEADENIDTGNAVFSRFPITGQSVTFFNEPYGERTEWTPESYGKTPRNLQSVMIDVEGKVLNVFNFQGVWDLNGTNDSPQRLQMSKTIVDAIQEKSNVILAGDTNVQPDTQTIRNIEQHLRSVFKDELSTTFNVRRKDLEKFPGYATAVVDMFFISPDLKVKEHSCPDVDISDHLPLVATLEIAG